VAADDTHRASDAEREAVADRLRAAAGEGRLDNDELEERLGRAYAARTVGDLATLTTDLPVLLPSAPPEPRRPALRSAHVRSKLASFVTANVVCIAVWAATGEGSFWPIWVLLGTGIGLFSTLVRSLLGVEDDVESPRSTGRRG
jgi:hypothetical protein